MFKLGDRAQMQPTQVTFKVQSSFKGYKVKKNGQNIGVCASVSPLLW